MKIQIHGAKGQLGRELCLQCRRKGLDFQGLDLPEVDICRPSDAAAAIGAFAPDLVVNAAAYTAVDRAEAEPETAFAVNRDGAENLAAACAAHGAPMVHVSTDYVFDGRSDRPYTEDDPIAPQGIYGRSKAEGEAAVRRALDRHLILRTAWLYGVYGQNFVKTMLRLGSREAVVRVVADQCGCPTSAADLAAAILDLGGKLAPESDPAWGTYHYCGRGVTTWHEFAEALFRIARGRFNLKVASVEAITTAEFSAPAPRPAYSVLSCEKIHRCFGIGTQPWTESLQRVVNGIADREDREKGLPE